MQGLSRPTMVSQFNAKAQCLDRLSSIKYGSTKMGENNRFSFAKTSFENSTQELSGFLVGEIASLDYSLSMFVGSVG